LSFTLPQKRVIDNYLKLIYKERRNVSQKRRNEMARSVKENLKRLLKIYGTVALVGASLPFVGLAILIIWSLVTKALT
jgi:hypothetical protein